MHVFEGMYGRVAVAVERGVVAVAPSQPRLPDGHLGEIDLAEVEDISANERVARGEHQVDVDVGAFFEVARHVEVEIAHDVHQLFGTVGSVGCTALEPDFLSVPVAIDDGTVEGVIA